MQCIKIGGNAPSLNHLFYADDLLLAGRANERNAKAIWDCLEKFCHWSGQQVDKDISSILFLSGMSREVKSKISTLWGLHCMKGNSCYLGNALIMGKYSMRDFIKLRDRVQVRLERWQNKLLSKASKSTLIKSIIQAILIYNISTFKIPKGICDDLDALVKWFWWVQSKAPIGFWL